MLELRLVGEAEGPARVRLARTRRYVQLVAKKGPIWSVKLAEAYVVKADLA